MAESLKERLLGETIRPLIVADCVKLIDRQVSQKRGFSGIAIKGAYKAVTAIKRGFVPGVVDALLDEWVDKLIIFYERWQAAGAEQSLADYLSDHRSQVAEALVSVTDDRAKTTKHKRAKKFYERLRPTALSNVQDAVPDLGRLVERHALAAPEVSAVSA